MADRLFLLAMYPTLAIFVCASLWVLIGHVTIPAIRNGTVSKYMIGVGGTVFAIAVALEIVIYGPGRWSREWAWIGNIFALAAIAKLGLLMGSLMMLASIVEPERRAVRLGWLCGSALGVWSAWVGVAYLVMGENY